MLRNELLPKCTLAIINENIQSATKCWKGLLSEIKLYDQSAVTETKLLSQLIADTYYGERNRILTIIKFVKNNVVRGSELAFSAYDTLLNEMDAYGQLYFRDVRADNGLGSGLKENTYRVLYAIEEAEGYSSPIFTQKLPSVVNNILKGKEIFIRNSVTKSFLYASPTNSTILLLGKDNGNATDARYIWKLTPAMTQWDNNDRELFYITNTLEDKILAVGGGSVVLAEATEEKVKSTWAMFYIQLVQGASGEEVAIQCSFWGIKTLALDGNGAQTRLLKMESLEKTPSAVWLLQPAN